jgi:uncharacterized protein YcbK (DUF882 family)
MGDISKNFNYSEFRCKDQEGTEVPAGYLANVKKLVDTILQPLRDILGEPIHIHSGYRTVAHNKAVGGAKNSQHLVAKAADITVKSKTPKQLAAIIEKKFNPKGMGIYPGFIHVDVRTGKRARW